MQRVIQLSGQRLGGQVGVGGREQVGAADVADEQRVAGEHAVGDRVVGMLVHDDADRLGRVPRCRHDLQGDVAEGEPLAIDELLCRELEAAPLPYEITAPVLFGQLEVAAEEVGVDMRFDDPLDGQPMVVGLVEIDGDVAPRVDDDSPAAALVADEVRGVRQARQIVLGKDHRPPTARQTASLTTTAVTIPNMPSEDSTWLRIWQCQTHVPGRSALKITV